MSTSLQTTITTLQVAVKQLSETQTAATSQRMAALEVENGELREHNGKLAEALKSVQSSSAFTNAVLNVRVCSSKRSDRSGRRDFEATQETVTRRSFTTVSRSIDRYIRFERPILSSWATIRFTNFNLLSSGGNHHLHYGIVCRNLLQGPGSVS